MKQGGRAAGIMLAAAMLAACGDRRSPEEKAQAYRDEAARSLADCRTCADKRDAKGSRKAADAARAAALNIERLLSAAPATATAPATAPRTEWGEIQRALAAARASAEEAEGIAALVAEEVQLAEALGAWKLKLYRGGRALAIRGVCEGLAMAADAANRTPMEKLPEHVRDAARIAVDLDKAMTGRGPRPDGTPDWPAIAGDIRTLGSSPPTELGVVLAIGYLVTARDDLALAEIESVDAAKIVDPRTKATYYLLRGVIYRMQGMPILAHRQFETAAGEGLAEREIGPEFQGTLHALLALDYMSNHEYGKADIEAGKAIRVWPNNPVSVFVTGEQLLASGEKEKAAESLEAALKDSRYEWMAGPIAERVRQIRDSKGKPPALVGDPKFLGQVVVRYVCWELKESAAGKKVGEWGKVAEEFAGRVTGALPG